MKDRIKRILSEVKGNPLLLDKIQDETDIINEIGLDSLQLINFILKIEEVFNLELDFDNLDFSHLSSLRNFCEFLEDQQMKGKPAW
jgi:acyl carrier protein